MLLKGSLLAHLLLVVLLLFRWSTRHFFLVRLERYSELFDLLFVLYLLSFNFRQQIRLVRILRNVLLSRSELWLVSGCPRNLRSALEFLRDGLLSLLEGLVDLLGLVDWAADVIVLDVLVGRVDH